MKYLCLAYGDERTLEAMSDAELHAIIEETLAYNEELRFGGRLLAAELLQSGRSAVIVRVRDGKTLVTDGPFVETDKHLAGFFLITARDLNEAIQIASRMVQARVGCLEVRPIREPDGAQSGSRG